MSKSLSTDPRAKTPCAPSCSSTRNRAARGTRGAAARGGRARRWLALLGLAVGARLGAACVFSPTISAEGYTACLTDTDCGAGRLCGEGFCAPPPWNDKGFAARQHFVVHNASDAPIPAGAAIPIRIGADGLIGSRDLGVDGHFSYFDVDTLAWRGLPEFRDLYADHLFVWLPVAVEVGPGEEASLAWLETQTGQNEPTLFEDPESVFLLFDDFVGDTWSEARYRHYGTGTPTVRDGRINVADNQDLVSQIGLSPPFSLVVRAKINGVTCSRFFIGLTANDDQGFNVPSVGWFSNNALEVFPEVAPTAESQPRAVGDAYTIDTAEHRYQIDVGDGQARFIVDDEVIVTTELRPPIAPEPLFFRVQVSDGCSLDIERLMVSPVPFVTPKVRAESRVTYQIFD